MKFKITQNNSYCQVDSNAPEIVHQTIKKLLTYRNDIDAEKNMLFGKMNYAKRSGNTKLYNATLGAIKKLEQTEYVCWYNDFQFPTGHLDLVQDLLKELKISYDFVDERQPVDPYLILPWVNTPHKARYYQQEMIDLCMKTGRGVCESAVGTGKSLVMTYLIKNLAVNSLVVVPSRGLLQQLYVDFECWFGSGKVEMVNSAKVRKGGDMKPIRIITIQSLAALQKSGDLNLLTQDIDALYLDEFHHAGSASYTNLLSEIGHIYYRFGFTGTFLRNDSKQLDMWGFLSHKLYSYPAWKAIDEGYLTPVKLHTYELYGNPKRQYQKEYDANYCGSSVILEKVLDIVSNAKLSEQILILVNKKDKAGKIFFEYLNMHDLEVSYISGDNKKEEINQTIENFNNKKIRILIGSSVIGEGIDVRSTDHLIMCQGGKSEIICVQAVGRAVRLYKDKEVARVHDFNFSNTKYMSKHFEQRLDIYKRNFEPTIEES